MMHSVETKVQTSVPHKQSRLQRMGLLPLKSAAIWRIVQHIKLELDFCSLFRSISELLADFGGCGKVVVFGPGWTCFDWYW